MALTKSVTEFGTVFPDAYFKIEGYQIAEGRVGEDGTKYYIANPAVVCYTDDTKEYTLQLNQQIPSKPRQDFTEDGNTLSSMYTWLKTLPEFEGAIDS